MGGGGEKRKVFFSSRDTGWEGENFVAVSPIETTSPDQEKLLAVFLLNAPSNIKVNIATNNSLSSHRRRRRPSWIA